MKHATDPRITRSPRASKVTTLPRLIALVTLSAATVMGLVRRHGTGPSEGSRPERSDRV